MISALFPLIDEALPQDAATEVGFIRVYRLRSEPMSEERHDIKARVAHTSRITPL